MGGLSAVVLDARKPPRRGHPLRSRFARPRPLTLREGDGSWTRESGGYAVYAVNPLRLVALAAPPFC